MAATAPRPTTLHPATAEEPRTESAADAAILANATDAVEVEPASKVVEAGPEDAGDAVVERSVPSPLRRDKPAKAPARKTEVKVVASSGLKTAQLRLGSKLLSVGSGAHEITSGTWPVKWRRTPSDVWQRSDKHHFKAGKRWIVHIGKNGPHIREGQ